MAPSGAARTWRNALADYVQISKPRIVVLLLVVAWAAMFVAASGPPPLQTFLAVSAAGILSTAASGAFNNAVERDRDRRMGRTADRPVAQGRITLRAATTYGIVTAVLAALTLAAVGAWVASMLTVGAVAYYVVVYTIWLKPLTTQNIVIGGFAGSFPALIGWAAVEGTVLAVPAWALAALVFVWTPAHFWALALLYERDYRAAGFPMYPVRKGAPATRRAILAYSLLTVAVSAVLLPLGAGGWVYGVAAGALGVSLVALATRLQRHNGPTRYRSFFLFTIQYLGLLLVALIADRWVGG